MTFQTHRATRWGKVAAVVAGLALLAACADKEESLRTMCEDLADEFSERADMDTAETDDACRCLAEEGAERLSHFEVRSLRKPVEHLIDNGDEIEREIIDLDGIDAAADYIEDMTEFDDMKIGTLRKLVISAMECEAERDGG